MIESKAPAQPDNVKPTGSVSVPFTLKPADCSDPVLTVESLMGCEKNKAHQPGGLMEKALLSSLQLALSELGWVPKSILDAGCQTGELTAVLGKQFLLSQVMGVDGDAALLAEAEQRHCCKLQFRKLDATDEPARLPFEADRFDVVVSHGFLNRHPDPAYWLGELMRVTAEGLIFTVLSPMGQGLFSNGWLWGKKRVFDQPIAAPYPVDMAALTRQLEAAGFRVELTTHPFPYQLVLARKPQA
ncbi:MAG: class I SAM-dependent methyltransferase [Cyanobacteria bacterium HKST-UBA06]|nr:class I SAM-dependent methyltransferase [Cyanobacteria bacterium HKST-UBA06]